MSQYETDIVVKMLPFKTLVYLSEEKVYMQENKIPQGAKVANIFVTQLRVDFLAGSKLPELFPCQETAKILAELHPPKNKQGVCLWFTGLSDCGKSTLTEALIPMLMEHGRWAIVYIEM